MNRSIKGLKIAMLATDGVEQVELTQPRDALRQAQAIVSLVSPKAGSIQAMKQDVHAADNIPVDLDVGTDPAAFDALVLPGGTTNADKLRMDPKAVAFVKHFVDSRKPIAAICHGSWTLIEAGGVKGKRMTSWPSLKTDLGNAGATWVDETFVRDGLLATSRKPDDLPAFCAGIIDLFGDKAARAA
jgi:protease I